MTALDEPASVMDGPQGRRRRRLAPAPALASDGLPARRGLISLGLLLAAVMSALDTTVVNVAMPHMQGELSASAEQITWVITSYIVATAVTTPVSGWVASRFGLKPTVMAAIIGFTVTSTLCGVATSLGEMVAFRVLQGVTAAALAPLLQAIFLNISPPGNYGRTMALYSTAIIAAPVLGPVVGGYLTEYYSWRWCFYINVPGGILSLLLIWTLLPKDAPRPRRFDFLGYGALAAFIAAFQLMLDRGGTLDWFGSREICAEAVIAGIGMWIFVTHTLTSRHPLFPAALVQNRNFVICVVINCVFTMFLYSSMTLLPLMMQGVMGYPVLFSGVLNMPRGLTTVLVLQVMGRIDGRFDRRVLVAMGVGAVCIAYWQMGHYDLSMSPGQVVGATLFQGIGQGIIFVPISTLGFGTLPPHLRADGASFATMIRTMGASLGIAAAQAITSANTQTMHASLAAHLRLDDPMVRAMLPSFLSPGTAEGALALNSELSRQALMVAYVDSFRLMALLALLCAPLVLLLRRQPRTTEVIATTLSE